MTQRRVENTRVHFWTFSPVSVNKTPVLCTQDQGCKFRQNLQRAILLQESNGAQKPYCRKMVPRAIKLTHYVTENSRKFCNFCQTGR